jgi:flagellin-like protein
MKRKMRTRKRKALSPVIATIILIAVTVAVSIAVAAWMGALTFSFMGSSSLTITSVTFNGTSGATNNTVTLAIKNTGTKTVTVGTVKINQVAYTIDPTLSSPYPATYTTSGTTTTGNIVLDNVGWSNGQAYQFNLYDGSGNGVGSYQSNSPGS